jgi:hypothetical protein
MPNSRTISVCGLWLYLKCETPRTYWASFCIIISEQGFGGDCDGAAAPLVILKFANESKSGWK